MFNSYQSLICLPIRLTIIRSRNVSKSLIRSISFASYGITHVKGCNSKMSEQKEEQPSIEHLIRARVEMEYLRRDFSKHEGLDNERFGKITSKLDSLTRFQLLLTGGGIVGLAILQIFLKFYT